MGIPFGVALLNSSLAPWLYSSQECLRVFSSFWLEDFCVVSTCMAQINFDSTYALVFRAAS